MAASDDDLQRTSISLGPTAARGDEDRGHYLVVTAADEPTRIIEIGSEAVTIGRDPKQGLVFNDSELSRSHARVSLIVGYVTVEDLKSTNGTYVNGKRISEATELAEGDEVRLGRQLLKYERRDKKEVLRAQELNRDLLKANRYVTSLLPAPLTSGPVTTSWRFQPSTQLGGDAFGYDWLDSDRFAFYLLDVSGHGVGSAMHSVSAMNVLRQRALPQVDFANPAAVLASLNARFQMNAHNGLYFTMWYGVYTVSTRTLAYSAAGHHPAYLVKPDRQRADALGEPNLMIGMMPDVLYDVTATTVVPGSMLYLFSDGVYDIETPQGMQLGLSEFVPRLTEPLVAGVSEPERIYRGVIEAAGTRVLPDDFSLMTLTFE